MKIKVDEIKIICKPVKNRGKKLVAIVTLAFGDITIHGYRIWKSEYPNEYGDYLWITPPSYLMGEKYHPVVYIQKEIWKKIIKRITEEWRKMIPIVEEDGTATY